MLAVTRSGEVTDILLVLDKTPLTTMLLCAARRWRIARQYDGSEVLNMAGCFTESTSEVSFLPTCSQACLRSSWEV
jgi:hypothetical protein